MWSFRSCIHVYCIFLLKILGFQVHPKIRASLVLSSKESACQCKRLRFDPWVRKIIWRRERQHTPVFLGFPCGSAGKQSTCNVGDLGLIPGLGRSLGEGKGYPLQYSGLENSMDCIHGVAKSQTQLSNFHFPIFLLGKSHGQRSLAGYTPWGHKELDTTEH